MYVKKSFNAIIMDVFASYLQKHLWRFKLMSNIEKFQNIMNRIADLKGQCKKLNLGSMQLFR